MSSYTQQNKLMFKMDSMKPNWHAGMGEGGSSGSGYSHRPERSRKCNTINTLTS